jgi:hypothetical protein
VPRTNRRRSFIYLRSLPCSASGKHAASGARRRRRLDSAVASRPRQRSARTVPSALFGAARLRQLERSMSQRGGRVPGRGARAGWRRAETFRSPFFRRGSSRPLLGLTANPDGIDDKHCWPFFPCSKQSAETVEPGLPLTDTDSHRRTLRPTQGRQPPSLQLRRLPVTCRRRHMAREAGSPRRRRAGAVSSFMTSRSL